MLLLGANPHELALARADRQLTSGAAMRANRVDLGEIPGPRLVAIGKTHQRADRADFDAVAALVATGETALEAGDGRIHALLDGAEGDRADDLLTHPHAALALDTAVDVHDDDGTEANIARMEDALGIVKAASPRTIGHHHVLKLAFATLVADRTVERVVGEQHVQHGRTRFINQRRVCSHDHAFSDSCGAGRL
ncbi:hypothetical protein D9M72_419140 [compost metagenome]